ncbi:MAG: hypothetical protein J6Y42_00945 [Bacilli bacterium]|nr:hypothetical protein [Bacilli bacterium]
MKKLYIIVLILFLSFLTACQKNIFLKGNDNITIELGSEYVDEGIDIPSNYTYKEENNININKVGSYYYKYNVYDKNNKLVQEILRVVNVKDTISPRFLERDVEELYPGIMYNNDYFFEEIIDEDKIHFLNDGIIFYQHGNNKVHIDILDESNNKTEFEKEYNVSDDYAKLKDLLEEENRIIKDSDGNFWVYYANDKKHCFSFRNSGNDYIYEVSSKYVDYKYIISATSSGMLEKTTIDFKLDNDIGAYFEFNSYELKDEYINDLNYTDEELDYIRNAYKLLVLYIDVFSID